MSGMLISVARRAQWVAILGTGLLAGCSSGAAKGPAIGETVKVTGVVTLDGQPLTDAGVKFHPTDAKGFEGATGMTDAEGKYDLSMILGGSEKKPGVVPGKYKVTVSRWRLKGDRPMSEGKGDPMSDGAHETAPQLTANPLTSTLSYDVPAGGGTFDITLTSK